MDSTAALRRPRQRHLSLRYRGDFWGLAVILGTALALFAPMWASGQVWIDGDLGDFYWPTMLTAFAALRRGELPLWSPDMFGGFPLFADGSVGTLFPLNWILLLAPHGLMLIPFGRLLLAAVGMYVFGRLLGLRPLGATVGALVFGLNGFTAGHFAHIDLSNGTALLPWPLIGAEMSRRAPTWRGALRWLIFAGLAYGLAWLSLHPQAPLMILPAYGLWVVYRTFDSHRTGQATAPLHSLYRGWGRRGIWLVAASVIPVGLALGLSAVQVLPMLDLGSFSVRQAWGQANNQSFSLPPHDLIGLVWPGFFWAGQGVKFWGLWNTETVIYLGTLPLVLALLALGTWPRGRHLGFFAVLGGLALWTAFGAYAPWGPQPWLYSLPGYDVLRAPARFFVLVGFCGAYFAAVGADWLDTQGWLTGGRKRAALVLGGLSATALLLPAAAAFILDFLTQHPQDADRLIRAFYLDLPRYNPLLVADVVQALRLKLAPTSLEMWEAVAWLLLSTVLLAVWISGWLRRRVFALAVVAITASQLVALANRYVTPVPLARVVEPRPAVAYLDSQLGNGRFYNAAPVDSAPMPYLPFGVADFHGQSSLAMDRTSDFIQRAQSSESALLDLACVRYVLMPEGMPDTRGWINQVGFRHTRPIVVLDADTSPTLSQFVIPTPAPPTRELRALVALSNTGDVEQGAEVAEAVVTSVAGTTRRLSIRAGIEASDTEYHRADVFGTIRHNRVPPAWKWVDRDERGIAYDKLLFYVRLPLDSTDDFQAERIQFRVTRPGAGLIVFGASLVNPATNALVSLTRYHLARYRLVYSDRETRIYANRTALPRAFLVGQAVQFPSSDKAMERLLRASFDVSRRIALEGEIPAAARPLVVDGPLDRRTPLPPAPDPATLGEVEIVTDGATHVTLRATTTAPSFLFLADTYYPSWEATVNGAPTPILLANTMFRAIYLPPGAHTIDFSYNAHSVRLGGVISLLTLTLMLGTVHMLGRPPRFEPSEANRPSVWFF